MRKMRPMKQVRMLKSLNKSNVLILLSLMCLCLSACGKKEDKTETFAPVAETQSEDQFKVDNLEIQVNTDETEQSTTSQTSDNSLVSNSGNANSEASAKLSVPAEIELSEEEAVFLDSMITSGLSDEEITSIIKSEENFKSVEDKDSLVEKTLEYKSVYVSEDAEGIEEETIDFSEDEEMQEILERATKRLEEDMKKEPIKID